MIPPPHRGGEEPLGPVEALEALAPLLKRVASEVVISHHGVSMHPTIPNGSSIRVRCHEGTEAVPGDVVAMRTASGLVTHRLLYRGRGARAEAYVITRGDALWLPDAPLPAETLLGVVTQVEIDGRWQEVGASSLGGLRSFAGRCSLAAMSVALELHVDFARWTFRVINRVARLARFALRLGGRSSKPTRRS